MMMMLDTMLDKVAVAMAMAVAEVATAEEEVAALAVVLVEETTTAMAVIMEAEAEAEVEVEALDLVPAMEVGFNAEVHRQSHQHVKTIRDPWYCEQSTKLDRTRGENSTLAQRTFHARLNGQMIKMQMQPEIPTMQALVATIMAMPHPFVNVERTVLNAQCVKRDLTKEGHSIAVLLAKILVATTLNGLIKCNGNEKTLYYINVYMLISPPLALLPHSLHPYNQTHAHIKSKMYI